MILIDTTWLVACALLWLRLSTMLMLSPIATLIGGPAVVRVLLTLTLAACLSAQLRDTAIPAFDSVGALAIAALSEALVGGLLGFGLHAAFAALHMAGRVIDLQAGFSLGGVFDPVTRMPNSALVMALQLTALVVFFAIGGHHALLRVVAASIQAIPLGTVGRALNPAALLSAFAMVFTFAVVIGAPVILLLLLLDAGLAVISKALPQMNVLFVGMPVKILAALLMLWACAPMLTGQLNRLFQALFAYWAQVID